MFKSFPKTKFYVKKDHVLPNCLEKFAGGLLKRFESSLALDTSKFTIKNVPLCKVIKKAASEALGPPIGEEPPEVMEGFKQICEELSNALEEGARFIAKTTGKF